MAKKVKDGEQEAKELLVKLGIFIDEQYSDYGKNSMPDIKLVNGDYIEVTHTKHGIHTDVLCITPSNEKYFKKNREKYKDVKIKKYNKSEYKSLKDKLMNSIVSSLVNIPNSFFYVDDAIGKVNIYWDICEQINSLPENIKIKYNFEIEDFMHWLSNYFDFYFGGEDCEEYSERTILESLKIKSIKKEKYNIAPSSIDCFIWLFDDEYGIVDSYYNEQLNNLSYRSFINELNLVGFRKIYFGKYDFYEEKYNLNELFIYCFDSKEIIKRVLN